MERRVVLLATVCTSEKQSISLKFEIRSPARSLSLSLSLWFDAHGPGVAFWEVSFMWMFSSNSFCTENLLSKHLAPRGRVFLLLLLCSLHTRSTARVCVGVCVCMEAPDVTFYLLPDRPTVCVCARMYMCVCVYVGE